MTAPNFPAKPRAVFVADRAACEAVFGDGIFAALASHLQLAAPLLDAEQLRRDPEVLREVEIIIGTWGMPPLDENILARAPKLRAVFLGAGSVKNVATDAFWQRNLLIVSAFRMNAIPVAEFALAEIIFSLKHGWRYALGMRDRRQYLPKATAMPGAFRSTVGLISLGAIGRRVTELLQNFEVNVVAHDPFCPAAAAEELKVTLLPLDELFSRADVVSVHTPSLPETQGLIRARHLNALRPGATIINTARGAVIDERELAEVLTRRGDLTAVLDVTEPMPPAPDSPLLALANVVLTPHIAGAQDRECLRLGRFIAEEVGRYLRGEPLQGAISREMAARMA